MSSDDHALQSRPHGELAITGITADNGEPVPIIDAIKRNWLVISRDMHRAPVPLLRHGAHEPDRKLHHPAGRLGYRHSATQRHADRAGDTCTFESSSKSTGVHEGDRQRFLPL